VVMIPIFDIYPESPQLSEIVRVDPLLSYPALFGTGRRSRLAVFSFERKAALSSRSETEPN
jgi:hypothetical protein